MKKAFLLLLLAVAGSVFGAALTSGVSHFKTQPYWGGKSEFLTENGQKVLKLVSTVHAGRQFGRAFAIYSARELFKPEEKVVAVAKVRGKGKFFVGILKYRPNNGMPATVFVEPVELSEEAKDYTFAFKMGDTYDRVFPFVQVQGEGVAYIESFKMDKTTDESVKLSVELSNFSAPKAAAPAVKKASNSVVLTSGFSHFKDQPYWGGKAKVVTANGKKALELTSSISGDRHFGRAFAPYSSKELFLPESKLTARVKARGKGKFFAGILKYRPRVGAPVVVTANAVDLTDDVKEYKFNFELETFFDKVYPYLEIQGEGVAYIESFVLEKYKNPAIKVAVNTPLQIVTDGASASSIEFSSSLKNADISITKFSDKKSSVEKVKSAADGKVTVAADKYPLGTTHVYASSQGVGIQSFVSVVSKESYAKTDAVASTIKLKKPIRMLMIGDSLSDFYRGYNYIDRLNFWINKYNPGKFSFHNAGVGGDFCERASNRMEVELKHKKVWSYRQEMYNGIFKDEYDYVFIFLGQNDTRCMPATKYEIPETTVEEQQQYLSLMVKRLKENCPKAKIVLVSPSPSDEARFDSYLAKGQKVAFYGRKKFVDAYDAYNRKFCAANKLDYVNITDAMRSYSPLKDLYVSDGVHLSDLGGILVSDEILKYFAKEFK